MRKNGNIRMRGVAHLSCGDKNCVYGHIEGDEYTYSGCKCVPYPNRDNFVGIEKIKSAKWALHHLRRENKRLTKLLENYSDVYSAV